ncbi:glycine betaine ABC transporter substrate-binding protein [Gordonia aichiensis]|uniref:Putative ABC transporter substrate-binding protein n=1 Tax=Gordonia aichiensis NBRC 108223 TaxID=1220583 RepID=L7KKR6_9ACTN|nr:putative ABC transporter substrate-binding protein [Gordonia aichiensis NBRC 108223]
MGTRWMLPARKRRYTVRAVRNRVWSTAVIAAIMLVITGTIAACSDSSHDAGPSARLLHVGAGDDQAVRIMAEIYAGALRDVGAPVAAELRRGDDATQLGEMDRARVDLFPAFSGELLTSLAPHITVTGSDEVYEELNRSLPQGVSVGDSTPVSATPQVFVATSLAQSSNVTDLAECGRLPEGLPVAVVGRAQPADMAAFAAQGCRFGPVESVGSPGELIERVGSGQALGVLTALDAAVAVDPTAPHVQALRVPAPTSTATTSDSVAPRALGDSGAGDEIPAGANGPRAQNLVPVFRTAALTRSEVKQINRVAGEITTADLAELARRADAGAEPHDLAVGWLGEHGL